MASDEDGLPPKAISYRGVYAMHKYWSKKPPNVVSHFINKFSKSGDVVLDSFCGSGVTISEAVRSGRKAIGIDLNPIAIEIARTTINPVDIELLKSEFHKIEVDLSPLIKELYSTSCEVCKSDSALTTHVISNEGVEYELWYSCDDCKQRKNTKSPSKSDVKKCNSPDATRLYFPDVELYENKRINAYAGMRTTDLFSPRAQVMISHLWDRINSVNDLSIREALVTCFTAAIPQASKMVFVINQRKGKAPRKEVGSWVIGYWTPKEHFEVNAWNCFSNRFKRVLNGKKEIAKLEMEATEKASIMELISSDSGYHACIASATNLPIDDEIVDYIFTDPPHGNRQPYLELSLIWNSWLNPDVEWDEEIVESEAKTRGKDAEDYNKNLRKFYSEARRVLRKNGKMTVCFNSLDDDAWQSIIFGCLDNGFELIEVSPLSYSATSVVQDNRKNALKTDFALTFQKTEWMPGEMDVKECDEELMDSIEQFVDEDSAFYEVLNNVFTTTLPNGIYYPISAILSSYNSSMTALSGDQ
tara:strand:+ start:424 stop:2010 length:1587 start_codon:yes stop_codon:yes gene_type:complete